MCNILSLNGCFQVGTGTLQESTGCLELFQEDVDELRSSTEELFFMEKSKGQSECEKPSSAAQVRYYLSYRAHRFTNTALS